MTRDEAAGVVIQRVLRREGGIADIGDGKGVTRFGQTPGWLAQFGLPAPTTVDEAEANYRTWLVRTRLIGVCDQPDALADGVIDWAVHAGRSVAIRGLQRALGVPADGLLGPVTQAAIDRCDRRAVAMRLVAARVRFTGDLITAQPGKYARWARGWCNRLAEQIDGLA